MPQLDRAYTVTRNTVWKVADPNNILIIVLSGECNIQTNSILHHLKSGDCIFIPANQPYCRTPVNDILCKMLYIHFSASENVNQYENAEALLKINRLKSEAEASLLNLRTVFHISSTEIFLYPVIHAADSLFFNMCEEFVKLLSNYNPDNSLFLLIHFCELLAFLSKKTITSVSEKEIDTEILRIPNSLKKAVLYIKQNYTKKISISDLCRHCNMSQSQITRYFKNTFQTTPAQYIIELKICHAKEMLRIFPELSVKSICASLGFEDPQYFSRIFRKSTGETPTDYRYRTTHFVQKQSS